MLEQLSELFIEPFSHPILLTALFAAFAASILSGIVGSYVVVKRIVFLSGSISHSVLGGIGLCLWLQRAQEVSWITPLQGAFFTAILSALVVGWIHLYYHEREDSVIAAIWSLGMAIGLLFISKTPGFNVELMNFLTGSLLWVSPQDLYALYALDAALLLVVFVMHQRFLAICFDEEQARLQGLNVEALYMLLLVLTAIAIVLLIQVVGIMLVLTLLTIPAAIANLFTTRLSHMMGLSILISMALAFIGTLLSYHLDWPLGATIALFAGCIYITTLMLQKRTC